MSQHIIVFGVVSFVLLFWIFYKNSNYNFKYVPHRNYSSAFSKQITNLKPIIHVNTNSMDTSPLGVQATDYYFGYYQGIELRVPTGMLPVIGYVINIAIEKSMELTVIPTVTVQWMDDFSEWHYHVKLDPITHKTDGYAIQIYPELQQNVPTLLTGSFILQNDATDFNITTYLTNYQNLYTVTLYDYKIVTIDYILQ